MKKHGAVAFEFPGLCAGEVSRRKAGELSRRERGPSWLCVKEGLVGTK